MRIRIPIGVASAAAVLATFVSSTEARAGIAWGDATLRGDDVTIEIEPDARATITHVIAIHVAGKRFRGFNFERVDAIIEPPNDAATLAGLDGPGWPVEAIDSKGERIDAFVEPTKDHRALHVRFGKDGISRGDYTLRLRYRTDFMAEGALHGEGALASLRWAAPVWPEGFDNGHVAFVLPSTGTDPQASIVDPGGETPRPVDGAAIVDLKHGASVDTLTLTRPHVPHHDDLIWIVTFDPRAVPIVAGRLSRTPDRSVLGANDGSGGVATWRSAVLVAAAAALLAGLAMRSRDAIASAIANAKETSFRPLVPIGERTRAIFFGASIGASILASCASRYRISAGILVAAMILGVFRAPLPMDRTRGSGRWLAIPRSGPANATRRAGSWLRAMAAFAFVLVAVGAVACAARWSYEIAVLIAMHTIAIASLAGTGRAGQLPFDPVADGWRRLAPLTRALDGANGARTKPVGRVPKNGGGVVDEVRLRIEPTEPASRSGLLCIEVGCAAAASDGASAVTTQLLVRMKASSACAVAFEARLARAGASSATFAFSRGRDDHERVLAIRPAFVGSSNLRRWIAWATKIAETATQNEPRLSRRAA